MFLELYNMVLSTLFQGMDGAPPSFMLHEWAYVITVVLFILLLLFVFRFVVWFISLFGAIFSGGRL